ncbi:GNAT family N-acetyltransferase [Salinivibrio sp. AR640]|uniref:GNAT family N-acetyltransferase n=1 Tax=Salinivibrio sp. AR640 TaxID=1909437 RepID=UPI0009868943|nr:GNAT family N-acetyltransferase [Salinivibrio sp. AR640]OOE93152.1 hypothetical protein BZG75_07705 [Salinivibrio sp. AR640]
MRCELQLCLAQESDFEAFLTLKSEPVNIFWSGFSASPVKEKLQRHFYNALNSETREVYLLKEEGEVLGYLYIDHCDKTYVAEFAYGVSQHHAGRGLAKRMIGMGLSLCEDKYTTQIAWIADINIMSIKCAESLGFLRSTEFEYRQLEQFSEQIKFYKYCRHT